MELLLPAVVAVAAIGFTYVFCIRPMRSGHCAMPGMAHRDESAEAQEMQRLRDEVTELRRELTDQPPPEAHRP